MCIALLKAKVFLHLGKGDRNLQVRGLYRLRHILQKLGYLRCPLGHNRLGTILQELQLLHYPVYSLVGRWMLMIHHNHIEQYLEMSPVCLRYQNSHISRCDPILSHGTGIRQFLDRQRQFFRLCRD